MTTPTVTITVGGVPVSAMATPVAPTSGEEILYMTYVQAVEGDKRYQFVVFPPARTSLGASSETGSHVKVLSRVQEFAGNRSKWFHTTENSATALRSRLSTLSAQGATLGGIVVVALEEDDYKEVWTGDTPHKALRAIDRALKPLQLSVK